MTAPVTPADARFVERVRSAPFIFAGRIVKRGASTMAMVEPNDQVAVVAVDSVFRAPPVLGRLEKTRVTVQLAPGRTASAGDRILFYATSWMYGDGLAVVEVAREALPKDLAATRARVARAELAIEDEKLAARLRAAATVVSGAVLATRPLEESIRGHRSEHEPVWWLADVAVDHYEKGRGGEPRITVVFPSSVDEYWLDVPKLEAGDRGVFLLHQRAQGKKDRFPPPGPALLDPLDFHALTQLERIRALLKLNAI